MIFAHGFRKFFHGGRLAGTARWFASIGMTRPRFSALAAASTEVGVGVLLTAGLLTTLACAGLIGLMLTAIVAVHWKSGFFIFNKGEGIEYALGVAVAALIRRHRPRSLFPGPRVAPVDAVAGGGFGRSAGSRSARRSSSSPSSIDHGVARRARRGGAAAKFD
jgi:DoxX-like protein